MSHRFYCEPSEPSIYVTLVIWHETPVNSFGSLLQGVPCQWHPAQQPVPFSSLQRLLGCKYQKLSQASLIRRLFKWNGYFYHSCQRPNSGVWRGTGPRDGNRSQNCSSAGRAGWCLSVAASLWKQAFSAAKCTTAKSTCPLFKWQQRWTGISVSQFQHLAKIWLANPGLGGCG